MRNRSLRDEVNERIVELTKAFALDPATDSLRHHPLRSRVFGQPQLGARLRELLSQDRLKAD